MTNPAEKMAQAARALLNAVYYDWPNSPAVRSMVLKRARTLQTELNALESVKAQPAEAGADERAAFEAWVKNVRGSPWPIALDRADAGNYLYLPAAEAWQVWQARAALAASAQKVEPDRAAWFAHQQEKCRTRQEVEDALSGQCVDPSSGASTWATYVAGMVVAYLGGPVDDERIEPIAGIIQRRMYLAPKPASQQVEGEAVAWLHECRKRPELRELSFNARRPDLAAFGYVARPLVYGDTTPTSAAVPEGMVLVPVEPTKAMRRAGADVWASSGGAYNQVTGAMWRAMLTAAPTQPAGEQG